VGVADTARAGDSEMSAFSRARDILVSLCVGAFVVAVAVPTYASAKEVMKKAGMETEIRELEMRIYGRAILFFIIIVGLLFLAGVLKV
jgi:hypothetical protein